MNEDRDIVLFRIDRKTGLLMLAALAVVLGGFALAQQLTLSTPFPIPAGIYNQLITTGNSGSVPANTTFNRNAGNTLFVPPTNVSGSVGIGTLTPASKLSVAGGVQPGNDVSACTAAKAGALIWASGIVQYCNGSAWSSVGASKKAPPVISYSYGPNGSPQVYWTINKGAGATSLSGGQIHITGGGWQSCVSAWIVSGSSITVTAMNLWCQSNAAINGAIVVQDGVSYTW